METTVSLENEVSCRVVNSVLRDHEPCIRLLVRKALGKHYIVLEASDGEETVNMTFNLKPDLILKDIMMPKMDGLSACYAIKTDQTTCCLTMTSIAVTMNGGGRMHWQEPKPTKVFIRIRSPCDNPGGEKCS